MTGTETIEFKVTGPKISAKRQADSAANPTSSKKVKMAHQLQKVETLLAIHRRPSTFSTRKELDDLEAKLGETQHKLVSEQYDSKLLLQAFNIEIECHERIKVDLMKAKRTNAEIWRDLDSKADECTNLISELASMHCQLGDAKASTESYEVAALDAKFDVMLEKKRRRRWQNRAQVLYSMLVQEVEHRYEEGSEGLDEIKSSLAETFGLPLAPGQAEVYSDEDTDEDNEGEDEECRESD
ncbi:hypothetical protein P153DRAFT_109189 [Dothidotthia symphoricarpi CBS 119687]|uniref:Uncharacterized protein n=1 Tax=Dothidotthia symphoricarpi CBS 119687 TaxID=1392245 RepID=A0A6A6ATM6_9PLEO|nr:uncharacterized protein P153DRAFT_109189 [Dothidotthia symphoricarpi CBS 119687]KAF2134295.1 hypothetical protein P153DRAFT_109189 [Dothidotthia symphoricarpi CBS 119687]